MRIATRYLFVRRRLPGAERGPSPRSSLGGQVLEMAGRMLHDLRHAIRGLRHQARFTVAAVAVLALGIGSAAAIFAAFQAVVVQDLPVSEPDRLVRLSLESASGAAVTLTPEEIEALGSQSRTMRAAGGVLAIGAEAFPLTEGDRPLVLGMSSVTADLFDVLGARPTLGRLLRPADGEEGAAPVAVIGYGAWQRDFSADPEVIGRRLTQTQTRRSYTIVGVAPPGLDIPVGVGYWIPTGPPGQRAFGGASMDVVARLADGVSPDAARTEVLALARALDAQRSRPNLPMTASVRSLRDTVLGDVRPMILAITTAVGLLLLIACVNVGGLVMIRTASRTRELMVRRALGASSGDVLRLLLLESLLIGTAGGALGLGLAVWLLRMLPAVVPQRLPRSEMLGLVGAPLGVALSVTLTAVLLFGVLPPLLAARGDVAPALRVDGRSGRGTLGGSRARRGLVAVQVALAVILLFAGGLVARSLDRLQKLDLGYDAERVGVLEVSLDRSGQGPAETFALLADVLDRMREAPGVSSATWIMSRPFLGATGILSVRPMLEGQSEESAEANPRFPVEVGGGELFRTLGIPIVRGRGLLDTDREDAPRVAVVSESVARQLWPGQDPVGQRIRMTTSRPSWWTVVGIAGDTRFRRLRERTPTIYVQYRQLQILPAAWTVAVRTDGELDAVLPGIRRVLDELDGRVQVWRAGALSDHLADGPLAEPRMSAFVLSGFGLSALLLAAIGLYGVMALAVRERMHELGVRRALGASARRLRWEVLGDALAVMAVGAAVGLAAALVLARRLAPLLYDVEPWDPATMVAVCGVLFGVGVLAALLPARRATAADPMEVLRAD